MARRLPGRLNLFSFLVGTLRFAHPTCSGKCVGLASGRKGARKRISSKNPKVLTAKKMHKNHGMSIEDICKTLNISRASFYRYISLSELEEVKP